MYVESLALKDFRNYESLDIRFSDKINILYGDNAQGKTNILEAIYLAATTRSHKKSKDKEIIRFNQDNSFIRLGIKKRDVGHRIDVHIKSVGNKGIAVDGIPIKRATELFGLINIIMFSPEDLSIVKNGPGERRRFMDMEICQLSRIYYSNLSTYNKVLDQRNNTLKQISFRKGDDSLVDTLDVWDMQLVEAGSALIKERKNFISMLNEIIAGIHSSITSNSEGLELRYEPNVEIDGFKEALENKRNLDIKNTITMTGPHRDDFGIFINDSDVRIYGSQGQQRTAALSLKLSEIELVKNIINDNPILLLDDVMSELDSKRREALLDRISEIQTIVTCTGYDDFIKQRVNVDKIYKISQGRVV
ncbi:DNA replication and repair protein RecF [Lachnospiraceae bacterium NE2001]|nr:DNA replication and repair protein RecF [Lachnospiraceae bacterium NE2001]